MPKKTSTNGKRPRVVKTGSSYDGSKSSSDFIVSGHSTGSANTEMEALSHQVSIDAGFVPDYSLDHEFQPIQKPRGFGATADVDGPALYGPKPPITGTGSLGEGTRDYKKIALWSTAGLLLTAAIGYFAYNRYGYGRTQEV